MTPRVPVPGGEASTAQVPAARALLLALLFAAAGFGGNVLKLPFAFNVDFIFGSIFSLVATFLLGRRWGILCAVLASIHTYFLWNHPYAIVIFSAEVVWAGTALRRGHRNLLVIDTLYWVLVGIPLVGLFYSGVQHLGLQSTLVIALKQAMNGILNALVAGILVNYLPLGAWLGLPHRRRGFTFGAMVFDISMTSLLIPAIAMNYMENRREIARGREQVVTLLNIAATQHEGILRTWIETHLAAVRVLADQAAAAPAAVPGAMQVVKDLHPDFRNLFLTDDSGRSVAFVPATTAQGKPAIGVDFSDRAYFQRARSTLQPVVSDVFQGTRAAFQPIFTLTVPVVEKGRFLGIASGAIDLGRLREHLVDSALPNHPFMVLLDAKGHVVASTDPSHRILEPWTLPPGTRFERVSEAVTLRIPGLRHNISVMDAWKEARYSLRTPVRGTDWTLVTEYPAEPLRQQAYAFTTRSLAALAGFYAVALLAALVLARLLGRASKALADFSKDLPVRIESGERPNWPATGVEELAMLTAHFRATAEALGERIQEVKDETERRIRSERALLHQSRFAAMGEMIANIAHQWRQPLNALSVVLGNIRDAQRFGDADPEALEREYSTGSLLIQKMSSTINDFRDFFRPGKEPSVFSALEQVQRSVVMVEPTFAAAGIDLKVDAVEDVLLLGFPNEYSQVVLNLLTNAKQAIKEQGTAQGLVRVRLEREGPNGCLTIQDNGGGVSAEVLDRIFDPYFTTREAGTGIGLYMSKQIIEVNMGGQILVENVAGGAAFKVRVPVA